MEKYIYKIIEHTIVNFEGVVYTNIVGDAGGPTKYGVTQSALSGFLKRPATINEVKFMTMDTAVSVYKQDYWDFYKIEQYPIGLRHLIFDMYVQHRPKAVAKIIQRGLNILGKNLIVDGEIGKKTLDCINCTDTKVLINAITQARINFYNSIVSDNPSQKKFLKGWLNRANWFLDNQLS